MNTESMTNILPDRLVYVKPILVKDLPEDVQSQVGDAETIFSVHNSEGNQLALVASRDLAFTLARQYDFKPVAVH